MLVSIFCETYTKSNLARQIRFGENRAMGVLPGDHLYMEEDALMRPVRTIDEAEVWVI